MPDPEVNGLPVCPELVHCSHRFVRAALPNQVYVVNPNDNVAQIQSPALHLPSSGRSRVDLWVELTKKVGGGFVDVSTVAKKQRTTYTDTGEFPAETFKKRVRTWFNGKAAKKVKKAFKDSHNNALEQATAPEATAREGIQAGYRL